MAGCERGRERDSNIREIYYIYLFNFIQTTAPQMTLAWNRKWLTVKFPSPRTDTVNNYIFPYYNFLCLICSQYSRINLMNFVLKFSLQNHSLDLIFKNIVFLYNTKIWFMNTIIRLSWLSTRMLGYYVRVCSSNRR